MAAIGTMMMVGREANSLGTLRIKSKPFPPPPGGVLLPESNLGAPSFNGKKRMLIKMTGEKQLKILDRRVEEHNRVDHKFVRGKVVNATSIFSQYFTIRSYDMGPNNSATIETLMNLLQETLANHVKSMGFLKDGFGLGSTPEMSRRNLVWVFSKMEVVVDRYPSWSDDVRVDHWFNTQSGKNGQVSEWVICDCSTGQTLTRATSMLLIMNKETRKLSKMPEVVRREMELHYIEGPSILDEDSRSFSKLDYSKMEYARSGLIPRWNDLDANKHVNFVKYVGLMLESVPILFLENHELSAITIEYRRECAIDDVLQSLTSVCHETIDGSMGSDFAVECFHLLRFESGAVVTRGRTKWKPKHGKKLRDKCNQFVPMFM